MPVPSLSVLVMGLSERAKGMYTTKPWFIENGIWGSAPPPVVSPTTIALLAI